MSGVCVYKLFSISIPPIVLYYFISFCSSSSASSAWYAPLHNKFWFVLWCKKVYKVRGKTWNQSTGDGLEWVGPPEHECLKFMMMMMMRRRWWWWWWVVAAAVVACFVCCFVHFFFVCALVLVCSRRDLLIWVSYIAVAKQSLENGSDAKRKVSFLWTKSFGLFGIKITAQLPIDDFGRCFISAKLMLACVRPNEKEVKIIAHKKNFLFAWFYFILRKTFYSQSRAHEESNEWMNKKNKSTHTQTHSFSWVDIVCFILLYHFVRDSLKSLLSYIYVWVFVSV